MKKIIVLFLLTTQFIGSVQAEISISNLLELGKSVRESKGFDPSYQFVKSNYSSANGPQLFYAAIVESHLGNKLESLKYLISGQIRSTTDMSLLEPSAESDEKLMAQLYEMIFYQFGGAGGNEIYQDERTYKKVFDNIRSYNAIIDDTYSPGWSYKSSFSTSEYLDAIAQGKTNRIQQLTDLVSLLRNKEYVALSKELQELKNKQDGGGNRALEIINKMREISGVPEVHISN